MDFLAYFELGDLHRVEPSAEGNLLESEILTSIDEKLYWLLVMMGVIAVSGVVRMGAFLWTSLSRMWSEAKQDEFGRLLESEKYEEALSYSEGELKKRPSDAQYVWNRGKALYALQRFDEARGAFEKVRRLEPSWEHQAVAYIDRMESENK